MTERPARCDTLLLGVDVAEYGSYELRCQAGGRTACSLSVGADSLSLSRIFKADSGVPNEDAVLAVDEGVRTLLAVADAHFGHQASHVVLERIRDSEHGCPRNLLELMRSVYGATDPDTGADYESETTLLVALLDRARATVRGLSFGDSTLMIVGQGPPRIVNRKTPGFVTPRRPETLHPAAGIEFEAAVRPGDVVLAFTDGVDECHYRHPETSIQPTQIAELALRTGPVPEALVRELTEFALRGIPGQPGGQDNIAIVATRL